MYDATPSYGATRFGELIKILFRWKGSIYRLIWVQFLLYMTAYITITIVYEYILGPKGRSDFEAVAYYCSKYTSAMPIVLLLGFYTSTAMSRWFSIVTSIPGTAKVISVFLLSLRENVPDGSQMVQQYSRWTLLGWVLIFRMVSRPLKKAYPDLVSLENAGFLMEHERIKLEREQMMEHGRHLPLVVLEWQYALLRRCNRQGHFSSVVDYNRNADALLLFKKSCGNTLKFAEKNIPSALTQVVSITVYSLGIASLMARDVPNKSEAQSILTGYLPFLNVFQYFLYFSWLKLGVMASDPFGDDDDDIDVKKMLKAHVENAIRLQPLYTPHSPAEELVEKSLENPPTHWQAINDRSTPSMISLSSSQL